MNFSIPVVPLLVLSLACGALACGDDDALMDASVPHDASGQADVGEPRPDSGPLMSCMIDDDCPAGLVCDRTTFTCEAGTPTCDFATCEDNIAVSCEGDVVVDCSSHGGSCADFEAEEDGSPFTWCDCGSVPDGQMFCTGDQTAVFCLDGVFAQNADCAPGAVCLDESDGLEAGCYCDDIPDGICPDPGCVDDLDCVDCAPSCGDAVCGDNGCGGSCGTCGVGEACSEGRCVSGCAPRCSGRECGADGCGGTCGTCGGGENCADGSCVGVCTPDCSGRECGSDGCGGSCGRCGSRESCSDSGSCVANCVPSCSGRDCGSDGCGGSCGRCSGSESCEGGSCVGASCGTGGPCTAPAECSSVSTGGERCSCFGDDERYIFDGSALDFSGSLRSARVRVRQIYENETSAPVILESGNFRTTSTRALIMGSGCSANAEITRIFSFVVDGSVETCEIGPESYVGQTSFTLTMPSGIGSGCSAPRL
ncbi:MAG: hypothetical protein AB8H86_26635 [Polyangiales bacterium]